MLTVFKHYVQDYYEKYENNKLIPFFLAFITMFVYCIINNHLPFRGDSYESWEVGKALADKNYNFTSFVEYRGFLSFFINAIIYKLSVLIHTNDLLTYRFFSSLMFASLTTINIPFLFSKILNKNVNLVRRILLFVTLFFFFRGYFLYPLTDFLGLYLLILSVNCTLRINAKGNFILYFLIGMLIESAVLVRSNYIICVPILLALIIFKTRNLNLKPRSILLCLCFVLIGISSIYISNGLYNQYRKGHFFTTANSNNLIRKQLTTSLGIQKVEWNAGNEYNGALFFKDRLGEEISSKENISIKNGPITLSQYISIVFKYPLDFICKYLKQLFNGLDITYPTVYVYNVYTNRIFFSLINYTFFFLALYIAKIRLSSYFLKSKETIIVICLLISSCIFVIPLCIEPRFFIPLLISTYSSVLFSDTLFTRIKNLNLKSLFNWTTFIYLIFVIVCFTFSSNTFAQLENKVILFNN